jgi:hypothetical protein
MELDDFAVDNIFDELYYEIESYKTKSKEYLALWRGKYEVFVYDILKQRYGNFLNEFWKTYTVPLKSDRAFVLVERRCHPNLWFLLRNIAYFGQGWSIYLFCSKQNRDYCASLIRGKNIHLITVFDEVVDSRTGILEYNELLKKRSFWEQIDAEHLCIFEMDCYLRKPITSELLAYDYVGTPWGWDLKSPGGSGLTLRKKSVMLTICDKVEPGTLMQDCFAEKGVRELGYEFMHPIEAKNVFVESYITDDPVGVHQWWTFFFNYYLQNLDRAVVRKLLTFQI